MDFTPPERLSPEVLGELKAKVLLLGDFGPGDIDVQMTGQRLSMPPELVGKVEEQWAPKAAKGWTPGPLIRVQSYGLTSDNKLSLTFGDTDYKEFQGASDKESLETYGLDNIPTPLVTSSVIMTSDGKMLIAQRRPGTHQEGNIDAIGGHISPVKDINPGTSSIDIFQAARREVMEETKLTEQEMADIRCLGLTFNYADTTHYAASFVITASKTAAQILERSSEEIDLIIVDPKTNSR